MMCACTVNLCTFLYPALPAVPVLGSGLEAFIFTSTPDLGWAEIQRTFHLNMQEAVN